jgi:broad specificity phosphatase PhoE
MHGFCGMDLQALCAEFPALAPDASLPYPWWTPAAEAGDDVFVRVVPFLEELLAPESSGDVLLVGHGASVQAATRYFVERCSATSEEMPLSWNCALTGFRQTDAWEVLHLRDTSHLPDELITSNARRKGEEQLAGEITEAREDYPSDDTRPTAEATKCTSTR